MANKEAARKQLEQLAQCLSTDLQALQRVMPELLSLKQQILQYAVDEKKAGRSVPDSIVRYDHSGSPKSDRDEESLWGALDFLCDRVGVAQCELAVLTDGVDGVKQPEQLLVPLEQIEVLTANVRSMLMDVKCAVEENVGQQTNGNNVPKEGNSFFDSIAEGIAQMLTRLSSAIKEIRCKIGQETQPKGDVTPVKTIGSEIGVLCSSLSLWSSGAGRPPGAGLSMVDVVDPTPQEDPACISSPVA